MFIPEHNKRNSNFHAEIAVPQEKSWAGTISVTFNSIPLVTILGIMKKKLSTLGILFMLVLKHPPMPEFSLFQKNYIVEVRCFSLKQIALDFFMN